MIHHGFKKSKRVLVILNIGEHIVGKFKWNSIRSSTIYKDRMANQQDYSNDDA